MTQEFLTACLDITLRSSASATASAFFFFVVLGSHLPMSRKLLGDYAALSSSSSSFGGWGWGGLQSPIKWYKKKKDKEGEKKKRGGGEGKNNNIDRRETAVY